MKRIAYAEAEVGTDARVADLVLQYAALLARAGQADTVVIPAVPREGSLQQVAMLLGPASQMAVFEDDEPFPADAGPVVDDLERRIRGLTAGITASTGAAPWAIDDFDDLGGVTP